MVTATSPHELALLPKLVEMQLKSFDWFLERGLREPSERVAEAIEESARLFGVAVSQQLHRALEIGEQHGDPLALPLESRLRRNNPL